MPAKHADPPRFIRPQLTLLAESPPGGDEWAHELKFDGYRLHARVADKQAKLLTRTGLDWTEKYEAVAKALVKLPARAAYIDGELCAIRLDGTTSFSDLQAATDHKDSTRLIYFAFDLLFIDGENLTTLPLVERKARLKALLRRAPKNIFFVDHVIGNGQAFYDATCKHEAEGIVSKRVDAPYKPGDRGTWRKVKCINEDEFVVVGFTNPEGRRPYLGALLLGYYTPAGELIYAGRAGTGMNEAELKRLRGKLKPLERKTMTVSEPPPRTNRFGTPLKLSEVHWVKPKLVAQVRYLTWTGDGLLRQVVYLGLRADKPHRGKSCWIEGRVNQALCLSHRSISALRLFRFRPQLPNESADIGRDERSSMLSRWPLAASSFCAPGTLQSNTPFAPSKVTWRLPAARIGSTQRKAASSVSPPRGNRCC